MKSSLLLICVSLVSTTALAQRQSPDFATKSAAMKKLEFLVGTWKGVGSIKFGGRMFKFAGTETVQTKIGGLAVIVEGVHKIKLPDGKERVIHNALGIITYEPNSKVYRFVAHLSNGRSGKYTAKLVDDVTLRWILPNSPLGKMRYTIKVGNDMWHEIGESSQDGKKWKQFFEMKLKKTALK